MSRLHNLVDLYLPGAPTDDLEATKAMLEARGYSVHNTADLQHGPATNKQHNRLIAMMNARAVVIHDALDDDEVRLLLVVCSFMDKPLVALEQLPALKADLGHARIRELDLVARPHLVAEPRIGELVHEAVQLIKGWAGRAERWFEQHCGWFFTNGMKADSQPEPVQYPMPNTTGQIVK